MIFVRLSTLAVLDVTGRDAPRIANNLCTADVAKLEPGYGREAFVTEVRGKTLGHVCLFRSEWGVRLIGAGADAARAIPNQALAIAAHFDRYTIREQSQPEDRSEQFAAFVLSDGLRSLLGMPIVATGHPLDLPFFPYAIGDAVAGSAYQMPWWHPRATLLLVPSDAAETTRNHLLARGGVEATETEFHQRRIETGFPWYGVDLDASNLPQEADRDELAISFTKGCYLGQETVARLDSLGQVQKKLVRWSLTSQTPPVASTELREGDRVVGRLTSIAPGDDARQFHALGFARRSHFDPGSRATGINSDGSLIQAVVSQP